MARTRMVRRWRRNMDVVDDTEYTEMLATLSEGSVRRNFNPYTDIDWDAPEFAVIDNDERWILPATDPLGRHPWYQAQSVERQIEIVRPEFLCLLGRIAVQRILETGMSMSRLRGKWYRYRGIPTIVTYHPAYLLRNPPAKKESWEDLQMLMNAMGLAVPRRKPDQG